MTRMRAIAATACLTLLAVVLVLPATAASAVEAALMASISTDAATGIDTTGALLNATVNPNGQEVAVGYEYGTTTDYGYYTHFNSVGDGTTSIATSDHLGGLSPNTTYHFRAIADNANGTGTAYGADRSFTTTGGKPIVTTEVATHVEDSTARLFLSVDPGGQPTSIGLEYGTTTAYGLTVSVGTVDTLSIGTGTQVSGLSPGTTYHYRAYGTNASGTGYGEDLSFTTTGSAPATKPTALTQPATNIATNSATLNGLVNPSGTATTYYFEYGTTTGYGTTTSNVSAGSGTTQTPAAQGISALTAATTYHFRIVATNSAGTSFGADLSFTTAAATAQPPSGGHSAQNPPARPCPVVQAPVHPAPHAPAVIKPRPPIIIVIIRKILAGGWHWR